VWAAPWTLLGLACGGVALACGAGARVEGGVVEIGGRATAPAAQRRRLPWDIVAVTLGHVVLGRSLADLQRLRGHERVHVRQYERWGLFFVPAYAASSAWQWMRGRCPYRDNAFEREARRLEGGKRVESEGVGRGG
jgi:hypothetical protein